MILFCLPYAGGSEAIYYKWKHYFDPSIEVYPVELKGRGIRFNEIFYESMEEAIEDIYINIKDKIYDSDFAIYGHSMGSVLGYELYYKICEAGNRKPMHIFFSGHEAPSTIKRSNTTYNLPDNEFLKSIMELGGISQELLSNKEFREFFIPIIRNDIKILETYRYKEKKEKIQCDVSILNGKEDSISLNNLLAWRNHVCKGFEIYNFEGDHFFINNNVENITRIINNILLKAMAKE